MSDVGRIYGGSSLKGLGGRIRQRREQLKLSQGDVVDRITKARKRKQKPMLRTNLSLMENGHRVPSAESLVELADALECSTDWLLGRVTEPHGLGGAGKPGEAGSGPEAPRIPNDSDRPSA
jgi:transcriptional regulator with XRE-family HTH domain